MKIDKEALKQKLTSGNVNLTFNKKDGSVRFMTCTLQESVIPDTEGTRKPNEEVVNVFDLEIGQWRSVRYDSITDVA